MTAAEESPAMIDDFITPLNLRPDVDDHHCFGCGALNQHGLHLALLADPQGDGVIARYTPPAHAEGYPGMVHGGIITTMLDEVMAWSLYRHGIWAVTGELTTRYRRPVPIGEPLLARGWIVRDRGRVIEVAGEIRSDPQDDLLAEGMSRFVRVPAAQAKAWHDRYGGIAPASGGLP
jgi:acyl-coenzyme A thioesterase PaaI-like protein